MVNTKHRIVKLVCEFESKKEDWGFTIKYPVLGLIATDASEQGALDKMEKLVTRQLESGLKNKSLKI